MKRLLVLFVILSLFLSACRTAQSNSTDTSSGTESHSADTQGGTLDPTNETTAATAGSGETGTVETTQGTESTTGTTAPNAGETQGGENTQPTQGSTQPTEGGTTPTEGSKPNVTEPPATEGTTPPTTNPTNPTQPAEVNLSVDPSSLFLYVGDTSALTVSYNGTGTLSWSSSNTTVATVSNGKVTAKASGPATITVTDGSVSASCLVIVTNATPSLSSGNTWDEVLVGSTLQIAYYHFDEANIVWSSDNPAVATVSQSGVVTGVSSGEVVITADDGNANASITIYVRVNVTSIGILGQNAPFYDGVVKYAGDYMNFDVSTRPYESSPRVSIKSSNPSVVSVSYFYDFYDNAEVTLNFKSAGSATITISSLDGCVSESYTINVKGDYDCNPGGGQLTPEQFVNAYNGVVSANGMSTSGMPTGYLVLTLSDSELTWANARRNAEGRFHAWWAIGYRTLVLTYEDRNEDGNHVFYVRGY